MANESALWKWWSGQNDKTYAAAPDVHMERIENAVGSASPDVEGQIGQGHFHAELKVIHDETGTKDNLSGRLKFEVGQREWGQKRWNVGGISYVLVEGFGGYLFLIPGAYLMALERIGTVKAGRLSDLSYWTMKKGPEARLELFDLLRDSAKARRHVESRLAQDEPLRSACQPTSELARLIGLLPA